MENNIIKIAYANGDGIGPEIMAAVLKIFKNFDLPLEFVEVEMGKWVYDKGLSNGMTAKAKQIVEELGILFKGPMETPKGKGVKSINVTARKTWNTFANVRRFRTLPEVETLFSKAGMVINLTIIRENIEDTYGGIEHFLSSDLALCRRFISKPGCEQVLKYSFEYAEKMGIKKITCAHKANIMKLTDGLFLDTFYKIAQEYPNLKTNDIIVDDLCMKLVTNPLQFELIVLTNLQGDIVSDLCAGMVGGLGFAPSANIGDEICIFEAVHGTAPDIAGQNKANPTALLLSGISMLRYLGFMMQAALIENALYYTLETHGRTADFGNKAFPTLSTQEFAELIIQNKNKLPTKEIIPSLPNYSPDSHKYHIVQNKIIRSSKKLNLREIGFDFFIETTQVPQILIDYCLSISNDRLTITGISNRGTQIWPNSSVFTNLIEMYCCRFELAQPDTELIISDFIDLYAKLAQKFKIYSTEKLHTLNGQALFSAI